jgi:hypothetical protein
MSRFGSTTIGVHSSIYRSSNVIALGAAWSEIPSVLWRRPRVAYTQGGLALLALKLRR